MTDVKASRKFAGLEVVYEGLIPRNSHNERKPSPSAEEEPSITDAA